MHEQTSAVPYGYCQCGCGRLAPISPVNHAPKGWVKGEPKRFVSGHHRRGLISNEAAIKWLPADRGFGSPCWEWQLAMTRDGYGRKWLGNRRVHAHRWSWEQVNGPIREGMQLDHLCRNRACVNPDHLEVVTPRENRLRSIDIKLSHEKARAIRAATGTQREIAAQFGICQQQVSAIRRGAAWKDA